MGPADMTARRGGGLGWGMVEFPLSGDVTQAINPFTWWINGGQQAGFININASRTDDPALERRIVRDVASYGRQLGRIIEALDVLVARQPTEALTAAEQDALRAFTRLAGEIAAIKDRSPLTLSRVDAMIADVRQLERTDPDLHRELVARITGALGPEGRTASGPEPGPAPA